MDLEQNHGKNIEKCQAVLNDKDLWVCEWGFNDKDRGMSNWFIFLTKWNDFGIWFTDNNRDDI